MTIIFLSFLVLLLVHKNHSNDVAAQTMMMMPVIDQLQVTCTNTGMRVDLTFSAPFNGIVFSKGHFSNPACRYVLANSNQTSYQLDLQAGTCGLENSLASYGVQFYTTTIVIQNDIQYQEIWDTARRLTCEWTDRISKKVSTSSFRVNMLDTVEAKFAGDEDDVVDVWMDVRGGKYPETIDLGEGAVSIGDPLSIVIGAKSLGQGIDLQVQDCYAHSNPDPFYPNSYKFQLTDLNGCVLKEKLISPFVSFSGVGVDVGNVLLVGIINAFAFPDSSDVFTSCNVEICKGGCVTRVCGGLSSTPSIPVTTAKPVKVIASTTQKSRSTTRFSTVRIPTTEYETTTFLPFEVATYTRTSASYRTTQGRKEIATTTATCFPGSRDPACPTICSDIFKDDRCIPKCFPGSSDVGCGSSSSIIECYPGNSNPECPIVCTNEFQDVRCEAWQTTTRRTLPQAPIRECYPGSNDLDCPVVCTEQFRDVRCKVPETTTRRTPTTTRTCYPGSTDQNCPVVCTEQFRDVRCKLPETTTRRTPTAPRACYPGSTNPDCPVVCTEQFRDVRCKAPETTTIRIQTTPRTCYPGSTDPNCPIVCTVEYRDSRCKAECPPGSADPHCPIVCTKEFRDSRCLAPTFSPVVTVNTKTDTSPAKNLCYPGSDDPECPVVCSDDFSDPRCPDLEYLPPSKQDCRPGSNHPSCQPQCFPGSLDPNCPVICTTDFRDTRCLSNTTPFPISDRSTTPAQDADCYAGSSNPKCPDTDYLPPATHKCPPGSTNPFCSKSCDSNSLSPDCTTREKSSPCYPGSKDPECPIICTDSFQDDRCSHQCEPGSRDPRCPIVCNEKFKDDRCSERTTEQQVYTSRKQEQKSPSCFPGNTDPQCPIICTANFWDERCYIEKISTEIPFESLKLSLTTPKIPSRQIPTVSAIKKEVPTQSYPTFPNNGRTETTLPTTRVYTTLATKTYTAPATQIYTTPAIKLNTQLSAKKFTTPATKRYTTPAANIYTTLATKIYTTPAITTRIEKTPEKKRCIPGSQDPYCPIICDETFKDYRCPPAVVTERITTGSPCFLGSLNINCPVICNEVFQDRRCSPPSTPRPTCYPGSNDPACPIICNDSFKDKRCTKPLPTTTNAPCFPGSTDPECPVVCTYGYWDARCGAPFVPTKIPDSPATQEKFECRPGSLNPECPIVCNNLYQDRRCRSEVTKTTSTPVARGKLECSPGSLSPDCPIVCDESYRDRRCKPEVLTTKTSSAPKVREKVECSPGSSSPECPVICNDSYRDLRCRPEVTNTETTIVPGAKEQIECSPGSLSLSCPVVCNESYRDRRCKPELLTTKTTSAPVVREKIECSPGSLNPDCTIICNDSYLDRRCRPEVLAAKCYPGSLNPECPIVCTDEFFDRRCDRTTQTQPKFQATDSLFTESTPAFCNSNPTNPICTRPTAAPVDKCYPGSPDPSCQNLKNTEVLKNCNGNFNDPNCKTQSPKPCQGPLLDDDCFNTPQISKPTCYYGTPDPECRAVCSGNFQPVYCPRRTTKPSVVTTEKIENCFPGSRRPACRVFENGFRPRCSPGSSEPECKSLESQPNEPKTFISSSTTQTPLDLRVTKEWTGDSKYHAFHKFHYQKGDGRRNERLFGKIGQIGKTNRSKRSPSTITHARLTSGVKIRPRVNT